MAANDPYETLGVARDATEDQIRRAYRKLAKQHHPDLNPGNKAAEERFKAISAAHELLSDKEKRARYDRGEIDASGQERPERRFYRSYAEGQGGGKYESGGFEAGDFSDIFSDLFTRGGHGAGAEAGGARVRMRGADERYTLQVGFLDAVNGATRRLTLPDGRTLDVRVPPGLEDGQVLRLRGQGGAGWNGGPPGDALIEVHVAPHPVFRREGNDIHLDLPVSLAEAVLGAKVTVPTPGGRVTLTVPPRSDTGARLRLRGRGVPAHGGQPAGDLYATLKVVIGPVDEALERFLKDWAPSHPFDPRRGLMEET